MTKHEALKLFKEEVLPSIIKQYGNNDKHAKIQGWNDWTDFLCKNYQITSSQYSCWVNPF